jgi:hypothetical protein
MLYNIQTHRQIVTQGNNGPGIRHARSMLPSQRVGAAKYQQNEDLSKINAIAQSA